MEMMLAAFIQNFAVKYPVILSVVAVMGITRAVLKPLMTFLHEVVLITPSEKDNQILDKIEKSKIYKGVLFVLDYFLSLKLKK